ncbi:hypothetical protein Trydic_g3323 [Trypoxylus dichotomus]
MVSLGLEKTFDKIRHEGLLLKMKDCGFPARILKAVRRYLQNRSFHTVINGTGSFARRMKSGVPQGFTLGPVLFTIYIKKIPKLQDHRIFNAIYADDTAIVVTSKHSKNLRRHICLKSKNSSALGPQDQSEEDARDCVHSVASRAATEDRRCENRGQMEMPD